jgi:hypothetical protein
MSGTKGWAFLTETGSERVTAREVSRERARFGGAPLGTTYWSTHRVGSRQRLKHVQRKGSRPFFSYMDDSASHAGDGGESLSHFLYKAALARLTKTQLWLKHGSHKIRITHVETEKTIILPTRQYRPDVYCRFECDGWLSTKWSGELYFEVWHAHRVPNEKRRDLVAHRVPVVEVHVSEVDVYRHDAYSTTEALEEEHTADLVGKLEKNIWGEILSDPSSVQFMEEQVRKLADQIAVHEKSAFANAEEIRRLAGTIEKLENELTDVRQERDAALHKLRREREGLASKIAALNNQSKMDNETMRELQNGIKSLKGEKANLETQLRERTTHMLVLSIIVFFCIAIALKLALAG